MPAVSSTVQIEREHKTTDDVQRIAFSELLDVDLIGLAFADHRFDVLEERFRCFLDLRKNVLDAFRSEDRCHQISTLFPFWFRKWDQLGIYGIFIEIMFNREPTFSFFQNEAVLEELGIQKWIN